MRSPPIAAAAVDFKNVLRSIPCFIVSILLFLVLELEDQDLNAKEVCFAAPSPFETKSAWSGIPTLI
jgi:hypothetical protein